jgi:hypothetical protein
VIRRINRSLEIGGTGTAAKIQLGIMKRCRDSLYKIGEDKVGKKTLEEIDKVYSKATEK